MPGNPAAIVSIFVSAFRLTEKVIFGHLLN